MGAGVVCGGGGEGGGGGGGEKGVRNRAVGKAHQLKYQKQQLQSYLPMLQ